MKRRGYQWVLGWCMVLLFALPGIATAQEEKRCCDTEDRQWFRNPAYMTEARCLDLPNGAWEDTPPAGVCVRPPANPPPPDDPVPPSLEPGKEEPPPEWEYTDEELDPENYRPGPGYEYVGVQTLFGPNTLPGGSSEPYNGDDYVWVVSGVRRTENFKLVCDKIVAHVWKRPRNDPGEQMGCSITNDRIYQQAENRTGTVEQAFPALQGRGFGLHDEVFSLQLDCESLPVPVQEQRIPRR
jgi:hypothetical protein